MKQLLYLLVILPGLALAQSKVNYKIYYTDHLEKEGLKVTLQTKLDKASDSTFFHYFNEIWGEKDLAQCLHNLHSENPGYQFKVVPDSNRIIVYHPTSKIVNFSYHILQSFEGERMNAFSNPRIQNQYFHLLGQSLFVIPEATWASSSSDPYLNMNIEWIGFPEHFKLHNTFGSNKKKQQLKVKVESQLFHSLFVGGDYRIYPLPYQGRTIHLAVRGQWKVYDDSTLIVNLKKAVSSQREFWNDNYFPYYTVIITPTITIKDTSYKGYSMKGTGVYQGFMLQSSNSAHNSWGEIKRMFNHEMLHEWIGLKIKPKTEELNYWFSEGFTDYYAYKNRLRSGDLTINEWIQLFNKNIIEALYKNPEKNKPNYLIRDNFWTDPNFQTLPYRKGALFALWLDNQILKRSNYSQSLDDLMREILLKCNTQNKYFTDEWFLDLVQSYLREDLSYFFQKHLICNADIDFSTNDLIEGLHIEYMNHVPMLQVTGNHQQVLNRYLNKR